MITRNPGQQADATGPGNPPDTGQPAQGDHADYSLATESRAFWKERGRALVGESPKAYDGAAGQVITVAGIIVGFYTNAIISGDFRTYAPDIWLKIFYLAPILVLLLSIGFGLLVFFPGEMPLEINSSSAGKVIHQRIMSRKRRWFRLAALFFALGLLLLLTALGYFLL